MAGRRIRIFAEFDGKRYELKQLRRQDVVCDHCAVKTKNCVAECDPKKPLRRYPCDRFWEKVKAIHTDGFEIVEVNDGK